MRFKRLTWMTSTALLAAAFVFHGEDSFAASKIGVTSAVKNRVEATLGGAPRPLSAGSDIFQSEIVRTGEASTAQLLFLDETSLSIGPRSEVTLDRFVFNPNRGAGDVVINASRGALRFITGSQKSSSYQIKTPVATIGVRGSIFDAYVTRNSAGQVVVILVWVEGAGFANVNGQIYNLLPGQALILTANGVQGPFTWDGTLLHASYDGPSFPLFGYSFLGDPQRIDIPDGRIDLLDQLNALGSPPVVDGGGSLGGGGNVDVLSEQSNKLR